jgi:succinate dehydrogenase/fumarate reductase flavoprotein subunit
VSVHDDVDVLILGAGASGLAAALSASARGAETMVVETSPAQRHTPNVRMSGGWVMTVEYDVESGAAYLGACTGGLVDAARVDDWARRSTGLAGWLSALGVDLVHDGVNRAPEHPHLPGAHSIRIRRAHTDLPSPIAGQRGAWKPDQPAVGGEALYRGLMHAALGADIDIAWDTRPASLVIAPEGRVQGVRLRDSDRTVTARAGVVVATGGFGASPELVRNHLAVPDTRFYGNPGNDGSGLRLAVSAGAETARMNRFAGRGIASFTDEGNQLGFMVDMAGGGYIMCDKQGRRYTDEFPQAALYHDFYYSMQYYDSALNDFTRSPSYYLFDQCRIDAGPLTFVERGVCGVGLYDWSGDNAKELARGWIGRGSTPSEAAAAVGASPSPNFDESVADYNAGCAVGVDSFGRPPESLVPLDQPPYYCLALHVGGPHTSGGLERDSRGRVLAALDGEPIPGLYGAGELGQAIGLLYPSAGCALSDALCSGLSVGETLAGVIG